MRLSILGVTLCFLSTTPYCASAETEEEDIDDDFGCESPSQCLAKRNRELAEMEDGSGNYKELHMRAPLPGPKPILSEGCGKQLKIPTGTVSKITMPVNDPLLFDPYREFYVYLPIGYDSSLPLPVIYSFHGYYSSAELKMSYDRFFWKIETDLANKSQQGFIVVYGQGLADCGQTHCYFEPWPQRTWNVWGLTESPGPRGPTCDPHRNRFGHYGCSESCRARAGDPTKAACLQHDHCHAATCANDTMYLETLMTHVESRLCVDKRRQYVTGMSTGAMMAYWVASRFAHRFAAAVPVAGSALVGFWQDPVADIPLMDIHGTVDNTIPANYSNGFVAHGPHANSTPMVVPGCPDCSFSNDGFYYTSNYNITRGVALSNNCSCTKYGADCGVKPWPTMYDGTKIARKAEWTCFQSFGDCGAHPIVRCTWAGNHWQPVHGKFNVTVKAKHQFWPNVAWEFLSQFYIEEGSEKEARLLRDSPSVMAGAEFAV